MEEKKKIQDELNEAAPSLGGIPKENPFSVPQSYFEGLPMAVQERIAGQRRETGWAGSFVPRWVPALALILVVIGVGIFALMQRNSVIPGQQVAVETPAVSNTELPATDELLDRVDIDEDLLVDALADAGRTTNQIQAVVPQDSLEQYIIDNYDDDALLIDEL